MILTSVDRLNFRRDLASTRLGGRKLYVLIPTITEVSFDGETQTSKDISSGDGTGRTVVWKTHALYANVRNVDSALKTFGQAPPGAEVGDTFLTVNTRDKAMLDQAYNQEHHYVVLDGQTYRITDLEAAGVGQTEEWVINLRSYTPLFRLSGY